MSFLYPLGLLGLIGIPILIVIYIIKNKYTEQTVASTYLWTLSERFLKRRNPVSPVAGIISLILQILAVAVISLAIAHPSITFHGANEYCFVLDTSASMSMEAEGGTRLDVAKERIEDIIDGSVDGSAFTLVTVGDSTVTVFERLDDKKQALELLDRVEPSHCKDDISDALGKAQDQFLANSGILTYLVTDKQYREGENVTLVNVASSLENYGISNPRYELKNGTLTVNADLISYENGATLTVELFLDGAEQSATKSTCVLAAGESYPVMLVCECDGFSSLEVAITSRDGFSLDDSMVIYDVKSENSYETLLVSDAPFFVESALRSIGLMQLDVISTAEYNKNVKGYGLYIFESFTPESLPEDGAVWLINPRASVDDSGFSVRGEVAFSAGEPIELTGASSSTAVALSKDLGTDDIYITEYVKCGLYRNFTSLYTYKGNPIIFAGTNSHGNREVVFAFDLHNSNLPVLSDYVILMENLFTYSFPPVVDRVNYYVGDIANINALPNCESIRVDSPSGDVVYLDIDGAVSPFLLTEVGSYTVTMTVAGNPREYRIYASVPESERAPTVVSETVITLQGEATDGGYDGQYDTLVILFICLALLFAADWMVYCYEKYQLR